MISQISCLKLVEELPVLERIFSSFWNSRIHTKQVLFWEIEVVSRLVLGIDHANVHGPLVVFIVLLVRHLELEIVEVDRDRISTFFESVGA